MDPQPFFTLRPSPVVMIAVVAMILALIGVGAWRHAGPMPLALLGVGVVALVVLAVALRRRA